MLVLDSLTEPGLLVVANSPLCQSIVGCRGPWGLSSLMVWEGYRGQVVGARRSPAPGVHVGKGLNFVGARWERCLDCCQDDEIHCKNFLEPHSP
jgi:hypothetical protein